MAKVASHINFIGEMISVFHSIFIKFGNSASKSFCDPLQNGVVVVTDFKATIKVWIFFASRFTYVNHTADIKTSFAIYKASKIGYVKFSNIIKIVLMQFWHIPLIYDYRIINEEKLNNNYRERLNDLTHENGMRKSELNGDIERRIRRVSPANKNWSVGEQSPKVTECLNEAARLLSQNMGQTIDEITRDVLATCATVVQAANGVNGSTPTELTKADLDAVVLTLLGNDADMISEVVEASDKFSTAAVRPSFFGFMDAALIDDLEAVSNFLSAANYPNQNRNLESEWGSTGNIRWLYTSVGIVSTASPAVYSLPIVGQEAYACIHLGGEQGEFFVEPLGSAGAADPLKQRGSVAWKHPFAARILNDSFMALMLCTHS